MSAVDDFRKLLRYVPNEVRGSLAIFASTIIVFGIGSLIVWSLPSEEILYGDVIKLLFVLMTLVPVLLSTVFLLEDLIEYRAQRYNKIDCQKNR